VMTFIAVSIGQIFHAVPDAAGDSETRQTT